MDFVKDGKKALFTGHDASRTRAPPLLLHFLKQLCQENASSSSRFFKTRAI
jgi:hypothetical protein